MTTSPIDYQALAENIKRWGLALGFSQVGFSDIDLSSHEDALTQWLENNYHGEMDYMHKHGLMRARAQELVEGTTRVISVRMDYLPPEAKFARTLKKKDHAYISRYALGRDYHKLMRKRLKQLGDKISEYCESFNFRPFVDSAPILERPLAEKAGLGWVGKHSLLINKSAGSWFFLGELLVDIPLPTSEKTANECGSCVSCIKICPTQAIVAPYVVDARRCISYLTIELRDAIPEEFRPLIGNRIYGCDDCQLICPWNKFANISHEGDFSPRQNLDNVELLTVFSWDEATFLSKTAGSPIRRIGFNSWQRNISVAIGNAPYSAENIDALNDKLTTAEPMVAEHIHWALHQQDNKRIAAEQHSDFPIKNQRLTERLIRSVEKGLPRDA
ncbi:tRNA epoxyqueuosine(34) reductase QueG [Colwellia hornerae]|uniref:Epoxyqueuosine reductase n=1 Tax=Colwellia hornerae TaxID=89402 RepID=A0A5C6QHD2_9GAMM|nr:tRNA epoxyqueuosine(34) reductase QueG [Colwellia hornerae]TWX52452.1 tRNA epoxyqueuosine(34) reductase QueG [Colwellia hornerae]TWX58281.1 tRNA epoxyqueuosine(34) reductase QueG [Colwellia hornerae]TWX68374.1 tRNA epoxyqueuosine(34) reductase QueG [Colwellia hornerae]